MKRLLLLLLVGIYGCGLIPVPHPIASSTPTLATTVAPTSTLVASIPTAAPGSDKNPLIFALAPAPRVDPNVLNASNVLLLQLEESTGYPLISNAPTSETDLINRFQNGNGPIGMLFSFVYLLARKNGSEDAKFD